MTEPPSSAITLRVRVTPCAKRNAVSRASDGGIKVHVSAPPEDGRANEAVMETIAQWLGAKRRQVEIIGGIANRNKVARLVGVSTAQLNSALGQCS
jgi:uncharacterized protein